MTSPRYQTIDVTEGTGEVLSRGECIARVDYTVRTRQELLGGESQEYQARRLTDGHVLVREGERQLRGMGPLVLPNAGWQRSHFPGRSVQSQYGRLHHKGLRQHSPGQALAILAKECPRGTGLRMPYCSVRDRLRPIAFSP